MAMTPSLDHPAQSGVQANVPQQTRLCCTLTEFALIDVWRYQNPTTRVYTCHSTSHNTMSRIDFILVSKTLLPKVTGLGFAPRALSDHSPCCMAASLLGSSPMQI